MPPSSVVVAPAADSYVDANGVAHFLGISPSHFYNLRKSGRFGPAPTRLGRSVRYFLPEVRDWAATGSPGHSQWQARRRGGQAK